MTNALVLPLNGWATVILDYELGSRAPFPPEVHRAEAIGRQVGAIPYWLYTPTGDGNRFMRELLKKDPRANNRPDWGMKMVHEALRTEYTGGSSLIRNARVGAPELEKIVVDFGYSKSDTTVFNYWDDRPALAVDRDQVKWIAMARKHDQSLLLVLQSWCEETVTIAATLNADALGFIPSNRVVDAETGTALPMNAGLLSVLLPGPYGTRILRVLP